MAPVRRPREFWQRVWAESASSDNDRAAVIAGHNALEELLALLLETAVPSGELRKPARRGDGQPSSLGLAAQQAHSLGLVSHEQLQQLKAVVRIRNYFAHQLQPSFEAACVREQVRRLEPYRPFVSRDSTDARGLFSSAVSTLGYRLSVETSRRERA